MRFGLHKLYYFSSSPLNQRSVCYEVHGCKKAVLLTDRRRSRTVAGRSCSVSRLDGHCRGHWGSRRTGYRFNWTVNMSGNDTTAGSTPAIAGNLGSLSWSDPINTGDPIGMGWTHMSRWTALTLTEATNLSITLAANKQQLGSSLLALFRPAANARWHKRWLPCL